MTMRTRFKTSKSEIRRAIGFVATAMTNLYDGPGNRMAVAVEFSNGRRIQVIISKSDWVDRTKSRYDLIKKQLTNPTDMDTFVKAKMSEGVSVHEILKG